MSVGNDGSADASVPVNPVAFQELLDPPTASMPAADAPNNLDLVLDVAVPVSVCLGRVKKQISEILAMGEGYVVELDRAAGDPVDLMVNGKLIARGEVVVVENRYGMRITEIVAPGERLARE